MLLVPINTTGQSNFRPLKVLSFPGFLLQLNSIRDFMAVIT